ncbi:MAG: hypothetical protein Q7V57_07520 [Actinomycetota bacterium]|nr:hypothetical protein [Actinomycetota bacterium]
MPATPTPEPDSPYGVWASTMAELVSYRHLGCSSEQIDRDHAVGHMRLRHDLRTTGGLLTAPVAIAMLDTAGICIDRVYFLALTHIDVQLLDPAADVRTLRVLGSVVRWARSQVFTEATFVSADDPTRVIGVGVADWAVIAPTPEGFTYIDPARPEIDDTQLPPLTTAYEALPIDGGYEIATLSPRIGAETLHHGPMLVALEATAIDLATATGRGGLAVQHAGVRIVKAGVAGPFHTSGEILRDGASVVVRSELVDHGNSGAVVAVAHHRLRREA